MLLILGGDKLNSKSQKAIQTLRIRGDDGSERAVGVKGESPLLGFNVMRPWLALWLRDVRYIISE